MLVRGGSDVVNEVIHSFQQHIRWTEVRGVRRVFTSSWSGVLFDCTHGVSSGQPISLCARQHLVTVQAVLHLTVTQLPSRAHALAGTLGRRFSSLLLMSVILLHPFHRRLDSPLLSIVPLSSCRFLPPVRVRADGHKQMGYSLKMYSDTRPACRNSSPPTQR